MTKANTKEIVGKNGRVRLDDRSETEATMVIMAAGIRPSIALAKEAGLDVGRGGVVSDDMRSSDRNIYALGECVEHRGHCYGLVAPPCEMARVLADRLAGGEETCTGSVTATKLKVTGIELYSAGDFTDGDDRQEIVLRDATAGIYKRLVLKDDCIVGAVRYGDTGDGPCFFDLLKKQADISDMRESLIFGQAYQGGTQLDPMAAVAALPDDAEICGCNGVCKSAIVDTIGQKSPTVLDDVRAHSKASASCGTCTGLVEQLMALTLGDAYNPAAVQPMCGCTELGHDDVRRLIKAKQLKTIAAGSGPSMCCRLGGLRS